MIVKEQDRVLLNDGRQGKVILAIENDGVVAAYGLQLVMKVKGENDAETEHLYTEIVDPGKIIQVLPKNEQ